MLRTIPASRTRKRSSSTLKCARTKIVMPLTVLSNHDVRSLLLSLTGDEIRKLQANLAEALRTYSTGNQDPGLLLRESATRYTICRKNGLTTMFLPASTGSSLGFKIMTSAEDCHPGN
ncbi:hypothetical protein CPC735_069180 [Coccidioides posadasii C735 delta SOWgp]|uniref:Uncharacterized protein n=2 Tax=Coccidioides posadasii TaxID=199306 RepID=A0A0J6FNH8_COCPO|nr:hypothetical protein CPC735_069180 [Coccidioides posadasii C735 delta SOWgp]EER29236.1 hypothetical protein CPC735_069180 [Coccidioides posadasii C735 delta SOWgp]KMM70484.1 hypothetical protein CPAG_06795 [Coccidioides posadasii RMSCC 3488]|eukprot:XP_003071381.1 hypothetical protein CPC735_069180 [Coccidioides posadasii C735 delta SOWgp]